LNTSENIEVRQFLYKHFKIKAIVGLPRNIFKDTPTLCSLIFAQKKTKEEIEMWDKSWSKHLNLNNQKIKKVKVNLTKDLKDASIDSKKMYKNLLNNLDPIIDNDSWFLKRGKNPEVLKLENIKNASKTEISKYTKKIFSVAGFHAKIILETFKKIVESENYKFPVYMVSEVGFKLSNRKEKIRPNQLMKIVGKQSDQEKPNFHLLDEPYFIKIETDNPKTVLDHIKGNVKWD